MDYLPAPRLGNAAKAEIGTLPAIERTGQVTLGLKRTSEPQGRQERRRPEEPDVRPTSPVPREGALGDWGSLLDPLGAPPCRHAQVAQGTPSYGFARAWHGKGCGRVDGSGQIAVRRTCRPRARDLTFSAHGARLRGSSRTGGSRRRSCRRRASAALLQRKSESQYSNPAPRARDID